MKNVLLFLIILFISCNNKSRVVDNYPEVLEINPILASAQSQVKIIKDDTLKTIINDEFANLPFGHKVTLENVKGFFDIHKDSLIINRKAVLNEHNDESDTIYSYLSKNKEFVLYKSSTGVFLNTATIKDESLKLNKDICVGMSKDEFLKKFNFEDDSINIFQIIDSEEYSNHLFIFRDNKLIEVRIYHSVD